MSAAQWEATMQAEDQREILTADEAADYLRLKPKTVYNMARQGTIPHIRFGRSVRFRRSVLVAWLEDQSR
jgi:excisionase family DNA binding protein